MGSPLPNLPDAATAWEPGARVVVAAGIGSGVVLSVQGRFVVVQIDGDPEGPSTWDPTWLAPESK